MADLFGALTPRGRVQVKFAVALGDSEISFLTKKKYKLVTI